MLIFTLLKKAYDLGKSLISLVKEIAVEFGKNGKLTVAYILNEIPGLSPYPGLIDSIQKYLIESSTQNLTLVITHVALALCAGSNLGKVVAEATAQVALKKKGLAKVSVSIPSQVAKNLPKKKTIELAKVNKEVAAQ